MNLGVWARDVKETLLAESTPLAVIGCLPLSTTGRPGEKVERPIGGDYSTDTIRVKLICEDQDVL
jgi:hypothetical protein